MAWLVLSRIHMSGTIAFLSLSLFLSCKLYHAPHVIIAGLFAHNTISQCCRVSLRVEFLFVDLALRSVLVYQLFSHKNVWSFLFWFPTPAQTGEISSTLAAFPFHCLWCWPAGQLHDFGSVQTFALSYSTPVRLSALVHGPVYSFKKIPTKLATLHASTGRLQPTHSIP